MCLLTSMYSCVFTTNDSSCRVLSIMLVMPFLTYFVPNRDDGVNVKSVVLSDVDVFVTTHLY